MNEHIEKIRVRYSETDQMGVVYHGNYLPYFEIGRVEWLRNKGISYKTLEENNIGLPIASLTINYRKSAKYDDLLSVKTTLKSFSGIKVEFECEITNEQDELLTTATFLLVTIDLKTGRPITPPDYLVDIISK